jgi:hypothetical protein
METEMAKRTKRLSDRAIARRLDKLSKKEAEEMRKLVKELSPKRRRK